MIPLEKKLPNNDSTRKKLPNNYSTIKVKDFNSISTIKGIKT